MSRSLKDWCWQLLCQQHPALQEQAAEAVLPLQPFVLRAWLGVSCAQADWQGAAAWGIPSPQGLQKGY